MGFNTPTASDRIFKVPSPRVVFPYSQRHKRAFKTPAEVDLYGIDFSSELGTDNILVSDWQPYDGSLVVTDASPAYLDGISSAFVGSGVTVPAESLVLSLIETVSGRIIESAISFFIQKFNLIPGVIIQAGVSDDEDYSMDWTHRLFSGETIVSSSWSFDGYDAQLDISNPAASISNSLTAVCISGGTYKTGYTITNQIITNLGRILESSFRYFLQWPASPNPFANFYVDKFGENYVSTDGQYFTPFSG